MSNDEKILKVLEGLQNGQTKLEEFVQTLQNNVKDIKQGQIKLEKSVQNVETDVKDVKQDQTKLVGEVKNIALNVEILNKKTTHVEKNLKQSIEDNANFFIEAGIFFDEMRNKIMERIKEIEEHLGVHKN